MDVELAKSHGPMKIELKSKNKRRDQSMSSAFAEIRSRCAVIGEKSPDKRCPPSCHEEWMPVQAWRKKRTFLLHLKTQFSRSLPLIKDLRSRERIGMRNRSVLVNWFTFSSLERQRRRQLFVLGVSDYRIPYMEKFRRRISSAETIRLVGYSIRWNRSESTVVTSSE